MTLNSKAKIEPDVLDKLYDSREITITAYYLLKTIFKRRIEEAQKLEAEHQQLKDIIAILQNNLTETNMIYGKCREKIVEANKILDYICTGCAWTERDKITAQCKIKQVREALK
jgi:hypothetical protein